MKKHKYLDDIGCTSRWDNYWETSFTLKRFFKFKDHFNRLRHRIIEKKRGVNPRECWDLDTVFYNWLYEHLMAYLDDSKIVDLTFYKFTYKDKTYNQKEFIDLLISLLKEVITSKDLHYENRERLLDLNKEICDIWSMLLPHMWW